MQPRPHTLFVKRKKFKEKPTTASRLLDRWEQQVFFIMQKHPHTGPAIERLREAHVAKQGAGLAFMPTEALLLELAELQANA